MTLDEAKRLLSGQGIPFEVCEFENEATYWHHVTLFPYTKNAKNCKVIALVIPSPNGEKNIELQCNAVGEEYRFQELYFGDYGFEMFDVCEDMLADDIRDRIREIQSGSFTVIVANHLKHRYRIWDACFDRNDDDFFGEPGFEKAMRRIRRPKGLLARWLKSQKQYEIYDWNSYQCILK